jgi:hypothetical protein
MSDANGFVVYARPSGSAVVMSVRTGSVSLIALAPEAPMAAVFGWSLAVGGEGSEGKLCRAVRAGVRRVSEPSFSDRPLPLRAGSSASGSQRVPVTGQSSASIRT